MRISAIVLCALLAACAAPAAQSRPEPSAGPNTAHSRPLAIAALGERVYVDGPAVTPLEVLEDSRCPEAVHCVWAGRFRLLATIHLGSGDHKRELELGKPVQIADGALELVEVNPGRGEKLTSPADYRFGFRFDGGY